MNNVTQASRAVVLGLLITVAGLAQAQVPANVLSYSRSSSFSYNSAGAGKGLLLSETIEPDQANLCVTTSYGYDSYGNKISATTANCAGASAQATFASRTSSSSFGTDGKFPISRTISGLNIIPQTETRQYEDRFGALTQLTGPNNLSTSVTVDAFGRKTKELRADATSTVTAYCYLAGKGLDLSSNSSAGNADPVSCPGPGANEAPNDAVSFTHSETRNTAGAKMGAFVRVYSDRQGRQLRSVTQSFDGANQTAGYSLALIAQDTFYNATGAQIGSTQPYFLSASGVGSSTITGTSERGISSTVYDALGRPTFIYSADPNGSQVNAPQSTIAGSPIAHASRQIFSYEGLKTSITNDLGQTRIEEKNINGQTIRVTDHSGAQLVHQHDAFGNLIETRDALQNRITISYDYRGRKISMRDPDTGQSNYAYDALGQLVQQQNARQIAASTSTTMVYDALARMTQRSEPEYTSNWTYDNCAYGKGKLCASSTSNGVSRTLVYDNLGRPLNSRTSITNGPSFASAVFYDGATGRVASQTYPTGMQVGYSYTAGGGFLEKVILNTAATVNPLPATPGGTPAAGTTLAAGAVLWQARVVNAWGKAEQSSYANNVLSKAVFEGATGRVTGLTAGTGGASNVLDQSFTWDSLNNLVARADHIGDPAVGGVSESFAYQDGLNRLTSYIVSAPGIPGAARTVNLQYNALGMLLYKSDVGNFSYPAQGQTSVRPHAVQSVSGAISTSYGYDANGNMVTASGSKYSAVAYTSFNLPDSNTGLQGPAGTPQYSWQYDENHQRIKEVHTNASGTRTTWMLHPDNAGGLGFESEVSGAATSNRHYLSAAGQVIGVLVSSGALPSLASGQTAPALLPAITLVKVEYWHKDHLGSLVATTDHAASVTARYAYDPFGKRRYSNGSYDSFGNLVVDWTTNTNSGGDRGFTGHEHLDDIGLVHMNGRIFDPLLGRFMQADPMIQASGNLQSYDRYQYCLNNPMGCTDPSGYCSFFCELWHDIWDNRRTIVAIAVAITLGPGSEYALFDFGNAGAYAGVANAATAGFVSGAISSGNMQGALQGSFSSLVFYGAGSFIEANGLADNFGGSVAVHAVAGCVTSVAGGGQCESGALSASFAKAATFAPGMDGINTAASNGDMGARIEGSFISAMVGGAGSALGGGKFSNGAVTGAFSYLFNDIAHSRDTKVTLYGRYAAGLGDAACAPACIHLSIVIQDQYDGVTLIDGQPRLSADTSTIPAGFDLTLRTNVSAEFQKNSVFQIDLVAPAGMSGRQFASALVSGAQNFIDGSVNYTIPLLPSGNIHGAYNSNSYASGLLRSVMGAVPSISFGSMQAPGWSSSIPACKFKNPGC